MNAHKMARRRFLPGLLQTVPKQFPLRNSEFGKRKLAFAFLSSGLPEFKTGD